jgi:hypothetical protein
MDPVEEWREGMRAMADTTVDAGAVIGGILLPSSISDRIAKAYDEVLFNGAKLRDLPDDTGRKPPFRYQCNKRQERGVVVFFATLHGRLSDRISRHP